MTEVHAESETSRLSEWNSKARRSDGPTTRHGPESKPERAQIERLEADGVGWGRSEEGRPVRVPGTLPGETVIFSALHEARDQTIYARLRRVEVASPERLPPGCPHFLACGGCDLLHMAPKAELAFKRARVAEALGRSVDSVDPVVPSPRALHYRAVAKFVLGPGGILGSYAPRSHTVVNMVGCRVHAPVIERVADVVRRSLREGGSSEGGRYLVLRAALPHDRVHVTLVALAEGTPAEETLLQTLAGHPEIAEIWRHINASGGDGIFHPEGATQCLHRGRAAVGRVGTAEQHINSGAFAQINPGAAERLYARVAELVRPEGIRVLDIYSGSGGIALTLGAEGAVEVLGVERSGPAVEAARRAAVPFEGRVRFERAPVEVLETVLRTHGSSSVSGGGFSAWVVNPPRKGLAPEVVAALRGFRPGRVVYVSCAADRLADDVERLKDLYQLDAVTPVDMFPQTRHVETVARLQLRPEPVGTPA